MIDVDGQRIVARETERRGVDGDIDLDRTVGRSRVPSYAGRPGRECPGAGTVAGADDQRRATIRRGDGNGASA